MRVYVRLYASFTRNLAEGVLAQYPEGIRAGIPIKVKLPEHSTLNDLVDHLALPQEQIKVIFVNGRAQALDFRLAPGDEVGIFPPVGGG
jgi:molybdopterin synthase sulfur carrier subunit